MFVSVNRPQRGHFSLIAHLARRPEGAGAIWVRACGPAAVQRAGALESRGQRPRQNSGGRGRSPRKEGGKTRGLLGKRHEESLHRFLRQEPGVLLTDGA